MLDFSSSFFFFFSFFRDQSDFIWALLPEIKVMMMMMMMMMMMIKYILRTNSSNS